MTTVSTHQPARRLAQLAAFFLLLVGTARAQAPAWRWGLQTTNPTPTDNSAALGYAVAADAAGRVYVGGSIGENVTGNPAPSRSFGSAGVVGPGRRGFVAQATAAGQWAWLVAATPTGATAGNGYYTQISGMAVTPSGDVYVTGIVLGDGIEVGGQAQALGSNGRPDGGVFVARLNSTGTCQYVRAVLGTFTAPALAADPSTGGVVLAGAYHGTPVFGATTLPNGVSAANGSAFVARLNAAGQWLGAAASTGTAGIITGVSVAVGPAGQVGLATSQRDGTLTFGGTTLSVPTGVDQSYVVAQLSPTNQWQWALGGTGSTSSWTIGVAYAPSGALWVSGRGSNGTVLGPTTLLAPTVGSGTSQAGFLAQVSTAGQWSLVRQLSPASSGLAVFGPLSVDGAGNAVALGGLVGYGSAVQATLGSQVLATPGTDLLLFVAGLSSAGQWRYVTAVPQPALTNGFNPAAATLDGSGNFYLTGGLRGGLTFGSSALSGSYAPTATYPEWGDVVLGKLSNATALATHPTTATTSLACYPNPARTAATLHLPPDLEAHAATLLDALGRPVRTYLLPAHATTATLDLTGLAPGLYMVRCGTASGRLVVE